MTTIPPTRTHKQLAAWINTDPVASKKLRAEVTASWSSTDRPTGAGRRLRIPGRGRRGWKLVLYPRSREPFRAATVLYTHDTSRTYRKHVEAREWVEEFLADRVSDLIKSRTMTARAFVNRRVEERRHMNRLGIYSQGT